MREFSPDREEEVIVMQLVKEIYGRENGWGDSTHHSGHRVHPPQQDFLLCLLASCADSQVIILISINIVRAIKDG